MNQFCECVDQGRVLTYCPRYGRDMGGRFREICAGINCDLGTAAAFREQWAMEAIMGKVNDRGEIVRGKSTKQRTRSEVLALRRGHAAIAGGCCERFADNQGCDCLERAIPDQCGISGKDLECVECDVRLYGEHVENVCRHRHPPALVKCSCWGINNQNKPQPAIACQDCKGTGFKPIKIVIGDNRIPLLLKTDQAPGDAVAMTAAIYSLHRTHPGKYITAVESPYPEIFYYNPDVPGYPLPGEQADSFRKGGFSDLHMHYPAIHQSNERGIHFMQGWCEHMSKALGVDVPLLTNRPHLYFSKPAPPVENVWIVCSGGKRDLTNKLWGHHNYQQVVNLLERNVKFVQVGAVEDKHPRLHGRNVFSMVGHTSLSGLFKLVRRARGVLCGVSLLMHVAAALEKPAVVIAGGREPVQWNAYPKQQYLHTVGMLPCTDPKGRTGGACWRSRVAPLGDSAVLDEHPCLMPIDEHAGCMSMVRPETVAELVLRYNQQYEVK